MHKTEEIINHEFPSKDIIEMEDKYGAHNYKPLPVVISKGDGIHVWDPEENHYYDFLSAYSALNQGHCHPRIVKALVDQATKLTLTSRAFYSNWLGRAEKYLSEIFGYDKVLFMNSGAEAVETAIKIARKWAFLNKSANFEDAKIIVANNNFHGRTINIISFSTSKSSREGFGPFNPGYEVIPYNDLEALEKMASKTNVIAYLVEPIQGEAGVMVPDEGYLRAAKEICEKYEILFIADEIQSGLGRAGKMLAVDYEDVKPDIVILGKALSGGMMPVSAVLANDDIMLSIQPGEHGSTFGGNPLGARITIESLKVIIEEGLIQNAFEQGEYFRERMKELNPDIIREIRGKGLLNAIEINRDKSKLTGYDVCKLLKENGLLAKQTHDYSIRFTPPLIITREEMAECCDIIIRTINSAS